MKQKQNFKRVVNELGRIMEVKRKPAMRYLSLKMMYHSKGQEDEHGLLSTRTISKLKFLSFRVSLIQMSSLNGYKLLNESLSTRRFQRTER